MSEDAYNKTSTSTESDWATSIGNPERNDEFDAETESTNDAETESTNDAETESTDDDSNDR